MSLMLLFVKPPSSAFVVEASAVANQAAIAPMVGCVESELADPFQVVEARHDSTRLPAAEPVIANISNEVAPMIQVITTGGTIDKIYFDALSESNIGDSQASDLFEVANVGFQYNVLPLLRKDSLDLKEEDRALIKQNVESSPSDKILITHGTSTILQTGKFLLDEPNKNIVNKTVVLVGAARPTRLNQSDAVFNLGFAACALQTLPHGVYIAKNGQISDVSKVTTEPVKANVSNEAAPKIQVITTGGTIDKIYFDTLDGFEASDPQAPQIFKTADVGFQYNVLPLLKKDSLELEEKDRALIKQKVESSPSDKILITHGTDTMDQTGKFLLDKSNEASVSNKTIVLVGAMQPAALSKTDAVFNLGFAACALLTLPPGVYITMNGQIFDPRNVVKNRSASRFEHSIPQHDTSDTGKS